MDELLQITSIHSSIISVIHWHDQEVTADMIYVPLHLASERGSSITTKEDLLLTTQS